MPGLVAGHNRDVRTALDNSTKEGPARRISVFARAENDEHAATGDLAYRLDGEREPFWSIGSINVNAKGLATFEALHATRNAIYGLQAADVCFQVETRRQAGRGGSQAVGDVWVADDAGADRCGFVAGVKEEGLLAGMPLEDLRGDVGLTVNRIGKAAAVDFG